MNRRQKMMTASLFAAICIVFLLLSPLVFMVTASLGVGIYAGIVVASRMYALAVRSRSRDGSKI